eukprot:Pgem_evm1s18070
MVNSSISLVTSRIHEAFRFADFTRSRSFGTVFAFLGWGLGMFLLLTPDWILDNLSLPYTKGELSL